MELSSSSSYRSQLCGIDDHRKRFPISDSAHVETFTNSCDSPSSHLWYSRITATSFSSSTANPSQSLASPTRVVPSSSACVVRAPNHRETSTKPELNALPEVQRSLPNKRIQSISFIVNSTPQSPEPFAFSEFSSPPPSPPPELPSLPPSVKATETQKQSVSPRSTAYFLPNPVPKTCLLDHRSEQTDIRPQLPPTKDCLEFQSPKPECNCSTNSPDYSQQLGSSIPPLSNSTFEVPTIGDCESTDPELFQSNMYQNDIAQDSGYEKHVQQVFSRRTSNPNVKTTKTGKILHKTRKIGVSKRNTAYNRFLQQRSKYFAKYQSHLTPQERMKRISEEWAVSEKNAHTTRRRSRFPVTTGQESSTGSLTGSMVTNESTGNFRF
ncbi:hypothetical protein BGZ80_000245 [Entomortierella chlamydospora]|uniref:Uncharacterized protein n=1 Tax=Entomortierella chlamydospora TaxID=101097 RepID=A0A9P6SYV1_9FUNG|nr:hypothetical protein BGZ80_000245 [Entomortierella chlamydospora]